MDISSNKDIRDLMHRKVYISSDKDIIALIHRKDIPTLALWLKSGLETKDFGSVTLEGDSVTLEEDPVLHLRKVFNAAGYDIQDKLRYVIARLISEWYPNSTKKSLNLIQDLSILAAFTRCVDSIDSLCSILQSKWIDPNQSEYQEVVEDLVGVHPT